MRLCLGDVHLAKPRFWEYCSAEQGEGVVTVGGGPLFLMTNIAQTNFYQQVQLLSNERLTKSLTAVM